MTMPYVDFVASRIKWLPTFEDDLMHACVGIAGEAVEYYAATTRQHKIEELGDLCFYYQHAFLALKKWGIPETDNPCHTYPEEMTTTQILYASGDILDLAKKIWVYKEPFEKRGLCTNLWYLGGLLNVAAEDWQMTRDEVQAANQAKLTLRYPTGYSDAAATARADKPEEAPRG